MFQSEIELKGDSRENNRTRVMSVTEKELTDNYNLRVHMGEIREEKSEQNLEPTEKRGGVTRQ